MPACCVFSKRRSMEVLRQFLSLAWIPGYVTLFALIVWLNVRAVQRRALNLSVSKAVMFVGRKGGLTGDIDPSERALVRMQIGLDGTMVSDHDLDLFMHYRNRTTVQALLLLAC